MLLSLIFPWLLIPKFSFVSCVQHNNYPHTLLYLYTICFYICWIMSQFFEYYYKTITLTFTIPLHRKQFFINSWPSHMFDTKSGKKGKKVNRTLNRSFSINWSNGLQQVAKGRAVHLLQPKAKIIFVPIS